MNVCLRDDAGDLAEVNANRAMRAGLMLRLCGPITQSSSFFHLHTQTIPTKDKDNTKLGKDI